MSEVKHTLQELSKAGVEHIPGVANDEESSTKPSEPTKRCWRHVKEMYDCREVARLATTGMYK
jgi:hypothetical protein